MARARVETLSASVGVIAVISSSMFTSKRARTLCCRTVIKRFMVSIRALSISASVTGGNGLVDDDAGELETGDMGWRERLKSDLSAFETCCLAARESSIESH